MKKTTIFLLFILMNVALFADSQLGKKVSEIISEDIPQEKPQELKPADVILTSNTSCFAITSKNNEAMGLVRRYAMISEEIFAEIFSTKFSFQNRILVRIYDDKTNADGSSCIAKFDAPNAYINIVWDENLIHSDLCMALSDMLLKKIVFTYKGGVAHEKIPLWLGLAFAKSLEYNVRPNAIYNSVKEAMRSEPDSLETILRYDVKNVSNLQKAALNSYWALRVLQGVLPSAKFSEFMAIAINSEEVSRQMEYLDVNMSGHGSLSLRWRNATLGELYSRMGGSMMTMEASFAEIKRLLVITYENDEGVLISVSDKDIWEHKDNRRLAVNMQARILEIKALMLKINSVYFDALLELGRMYQAVLDADEDVFFESKKACLEDFSYAMKIEAKSKALLNMDEDLLKKQDASQNKN